MKLCPWCNERKEPTEFSYPYDTSVLPVKEQELVCTDCIDEAGYQQERKKYE